MKRIVLLAVLVFSGSAFADGCDYIEGTWRIDRYDEELQSQIEIELVFSNHGGLYAVSHANDGNSSYYYEDRGNWTCDNGVIEVWWADSLYGMEDEGIVYLELLEANASYLAFREIREESDVPADRQAVRVSESTDFHGC